MDLRKLETRLLVLISLFIFLSMSALALQITTDKKTYITNEPVKVIITGYSSDTILIINSKTENYKFLGIPDPVMTFIPRNIGIYNVIATDKGIDKTLSFEAITKNQAQSNQDKGGESFDSPSYLPYFEIDKKIYALNDRVTINIYSSNYDSLEITDGKNNYKFLGEKQEIFFIPRRQGSYNITLYKDNKILERKTFDVSDENFISEIFTKPNIMDNKYVLKEPVREIKKIHFNPEIVNSKGIKQDLEIVEDGGNYSSLTTDVLSDDWKDSFKVIPKKMKLKSLEFKSLDLRRGFNLGLEELEVSKAYIPYRKTEYSYAIDPEKLNFSYARVTVEATGNELYKCALWNFTAQVCLGEWIKIKDISPGQNYTILLTPKDPAYAETTKNADGCYLEPSATTCTGTEVGYINSNGNGNLPINKRTNTQLRISFGDSIDTQMDQIVQCTVHIEAADSDSNTWTIQLGNYSSNTWGTGSGQVIGSVESDHTLDCASYFTGLTNDYSAFNTFGIRISTNDPGRDAVAYIDWVWVRINYTLKDLTAPYYSNINARPITPATYNPSGTYKFNTTWQDNEAVNIVRIEHNFTGILLPYLTTGNTDSIYYYNYGPLAAGSYRWRMIANDTSTNTNQTLYQTYIVNKASPSLDLKLNGVSGNITIERKSFAWINASTITPSTGYIETYLGGNIINSGNSPLSNYTQFNNFGLFQTRVDYLATQNYTSKSLSYYINVTDTIPPSSIIGLTDTNNGTSWILMNWTNPIDDDFNHTKIYVNSVFYSNVYKPLNYLNITDRTSATTYLISTRTSDHYNNINITWVNDTATTKTSADTTPPIIFNVQNISITDSSVNISFQTNEPAKPRIYYGTTTGIYNKYVFDGIYDQIHWFEINGLIPSTTYYYIANATDVAGNSNKSIEYSFTTNSDTTAPNSSNYVTSPSSPLVYNPLSIHQFNTSWTDNGALDTIWIEHNFSGFFQNITVSTFIGSIYYYDFSSSLPAGNYAWKYHANDSVGNHNETTMFSYLVTKATSSTNLLINVTDGPFSINEGSYANITGILSTGQGNITLWIGSTKINTGLSPLTNITLFNVPGNYNIWAKYAGGKNYTGSNETHALTVNDIKPPKVNLTSPPNDYVDIDGDLIFYFNVTDTGITDECKIYINGTLSGTKEIITQGINSFTVNNLNNGNYNWNVSCNDTIGNIGYGETWNFSVFINEFYPLIYPEICSDSDGTCAVSNINLSDTLYETHTSTWNKNNRYDYIYVNFTNPNIPLGSTIHWLNLTYNKYQVTTEGNFYLEWFNTNTTQWIEICAVAFSTSSSPPTYDGINCEFNQSGNPWPTVQDFNDGLQLRSVWYYSGGAAATVVHGTEFTSIYLKYTEDATPPTIELTSPADNSPENVGNILFGYIPSDPILSNCSIWGDFDGSWAQNYTNSSPLNDATNYFSVYLEEGFYHWNVKCFDERGNNAFALQNWTINITNPDLEILSNNIVFSNTTPKENQQITLNATIKNRGNVNATAPFNVQFYLEDPDTIGLQIGTNQVINYLGFNQNKSVDVQWNVTGPGPHNIYVVVDTPLATNGSVKETNEENNKAFNTLNVPSWTYTYGNVTGDIQLATNQNFSINAWWQISPYGSVYVTETGSLVNWDDLQALGRKADNTTSNNNDFNELDIELEMSNFFDRTNLTFTINNLPKATGSFVLFNKLINNVPIINTTINSNFVTGILWDKSDGGFEYDGTQDVIFVTKINQDLVGKYGVYDYEIRYPSVLKNYHEVIYSTVDFYTEIN